MIQSQKMEEYSRIKNFGHLVLLITFAGLTDLSLLTASSLTGVSYALSPSPLPAKNLPSVKIISPHKGQQLPVGGNIAVSGIALPLLLPQQIRRILVVQFQFYLMVQNRIRRHQQPAIVEQRTILAGGMLLLLTMLL